MWTVPEAAIARPFKHLLRLSPNLLTGSRSGSAACDHPTAQRRPRLGRARRASPRRWHRPPCCREPPPPPPCSRRSSPGSAPSNQQPAAAAAAAAGRRYGAAAGLRGVQGERRPVGRQDNRAQRTGLRPGRPARFAATACRISAKRSSEPPAASDRPAGGGANATAGPEVNRQQREHVSQHAGVGHGGTRRASHPCGSRCSRGTPIGYVLCWPDQRRRRSYNPRVHVRIQTPASYHPSGGRLPPAPARQQGTSLTFRIAARPG